MRMRSTLRLTVALIVLAGMVAPAHSQVQTPEAFFGFTIGADGELARYPKVLEYFQHLAKTTDRVKYEEIGKTTMGNAYALVTISSPANLKRFDRLVEINRRLADPRRTGDAEAAALVSEGRPFYLLYATIHSTEVGNGQTITLLAHKLATENGAAVREILDNSVLLMVPSQNPDGQHLVIDHWYKTKGTNLTRVYPDLYHKYTGHDDNRDWFMFTQKETRLMVERVQNRYKPAITHDMHQQGSTGSRMFVPPFQDPFDVNIHPLLAQQQTTVGQAMATALIAEGKEGVAWLEGYDMWAPARQYMVYHGQPRILTEIASASLADPYINPAGADRPLGPQESRQNFPLPYSKGEWRLSQIVSYGLTAALAGISHVAKYRTEFLGNFYKVHKDWTNWKGAPYAFVIPAAQRDPLAAYELLDILRTGEVEIELASAPFDADGKQYEAGSHVIRLAQPYGAFAKTMLERQIYPDLRLYPGGPPKPPYDVTGHTLGFLLGVDVVPIGRAFDAKLARVITLAPRQVPFPAAPKWAYALPPESNAGFIAVTRLQSAQVPIFRTAVAHSAGNRVFAPGSWIVPPSVEARRILEAVGKETGLVVSGVDEPFPVAGYRLKPSTRIGLWRGANNMPGGWLKWTLEQFGFNHSVVASTDFHGDLFARYDAIVLPDGITRQTIVNGLEPSRNDKSFEWAYGVGDAGWSKLAQWVRGGGTLVAFGSAVETARTLLDLPIARVLPDGGGGRGSSGGALTFYSPGSLLQNEFDPTHPVGFGMPARWPVFFESDQAYRLTPSFAIRPEVVARYPSQGAILASGWLLGEDLLRDQANVIAFKVGRGYVVTCGTQVHFRAQNRATYKLLFNALLHGPSTAVTPAELGKLTPAPPATATAAR
jgi:Zinc carboxypeptidase